MNHTDSFDKRWQTKQAVLLLLFFLLCNFALIRFAKFCFNHFSSKAVFDFYTPYILTGSYFLSSFLLFFFIFHVFIFKHNNSLIELLRLKKPTGLNIILSIIAPAFLLIGYGLLAFFFKFESVANPALKLLNHGAFGTLWFILIVIILGPVTEEVIFRGLLYDGFLSSWDQRVAIFGVSFLFSIAHFPKNLPIFIVLFLYSVVFIYLREISGSLYCSIIGHLTINSSSLVIIKLLEHVYNIKYQF